MIILYYDVGKMSQRFDNSSYISIRGLRRSSTKAVGGSSLFVITTEESMYLKEVQIRNYKNFLKERFLFQKGVNVIIGENDSGKTNLMQAIRLILDKRMEWHEKELSEKMFPESMLNWQGQIIIISLRFAELNVEKEEEAVLKYVSGNKNDEGSITWFCMPDAHTRKRLSECKDKSELDEMVAGLTINNYVSIITCGAIVDFLNDSIYKQMVGDLSNGECKFTEKLDESYYGYEGKTGFNGIDFIRNRLVDFTYIDALRDAVNDMKQKYNPLMTMLRQVEPKVCEADKEKVGKLIDDVNTTISDVSEIKKLSEGINNKILESVGNTYAPDIILKSELSGNIKDIFRNLKLKSKHNREFDLDSIGLGSTNIIYIALKLMEYSYVKEMESMQAKYFLLLFEEPEAHLHKHIQMSLFEKTGLETNEGVQVLMTTHSDNISAASKISRMNIISKDSNGSKVMQPYIGLNEEQIMHVERYLDVKRSELLFSKSVILVEGDAEEILIPIMVKKCLGVSLDELGISLINIGSVGFENIYKLFHDSRISKKCAVVSDLDTPIDSTDKGQNDAFELGKERKEKVDEESSSNKWVKGFFGKHTFEIEIVSGNESYINALIDKTYSQKNTKDEKKQDIKSGDVKKYGKVALKMAKYNKKGWNALLLSQLVDGKFIIPEYILDALVFVAKDAMAERRNYLKILRKYGEVYMDVKVMTAIAEQPEIKLDELLQLVTNHECTTIKLMNKVVNQ